MQSSQKKFEIAIQHHQSGRLEQAEELYQQILQADSRHADALHLLGVIAHQRGQNELAVKRISEALGIQPMSPTFLNNLGSAYQALRRYPQAQRAYQLAIQLKPEYVDAHNNLGVTHYAQGRLDAARDCYLQALRLNPTFAHAHVNLGNVCRDLGLFAEAEACCQAALKLRPDYPLACNNLGNVLKDQGRYASARECYLKALELAPDYADAHENLASAYVIEGRTEEASAEFHSALALSPCDRLRVKSAFALPVILNSSEHATEFRHRLDTDIERLLRSDLRIDDPNTIAGLTQFHLAYHGINDRDRYARIAAMYAKACPTLHYTAPHCVGSNVSCGTGGRLRIGFVSKFFYNHSVGLHYNGVLRHLSPDDFHVTVLRYPGPDDLVSQAIEARADNVIKLAVHVPTAQRQIAEQQLDVLYYPDIGMYPLSYLLAFARLAPVQCVSNGHPETTGIPTLDYYISCDAIEPEDAEHFYTERLIRMENIPNYYEKLQLPEPARSRADFDLHDDWNLYVCPQNLCKIQPDFDDILAKILRQDDCGRVVLFHGAEPHWTERLTNRFRRAIPDVLDRIVFLPNQSFGDFLHVLNVSDAILDTTHFCGGTTTAQALSLGLPIVTLPGEFMRNRITYGCYRRMGVLDCVAADADDYVRIALRLGTDEEYRSEMREKISAHNDILFSNPGFVRELEAFFQSAVGELRKRAA